MTRTSPKQNAFSSGEISPLLHARTDYQRFQTGVAAMRGYLPLRQGGFTRAPGTLYRGETKDDKKPRLIAFQFAVDDSLVLEFTPNVMRVWRYGSLVQASGGGDYELATPYGATALKQLNWVQSADVIYLADGIRPIQKLSRLALNDWTIEALDPETGPFRVQNVDEALTIQAGAETGTNVTLTASSALFEADHVGSLLRLEAVDWSDVPLWTGETAVVAGDRMRYSDQVYEVVSGSNTGVNAPTHLEGDRQLDKTNAIVWRHLSGETGVVRITNVISATSARCDILTRLPGAVVTDPTYRWAEGAWSDRYGYPSALAIHDQRLCAAATPADPRTVWFSTAGALEDFTPDVEADSSFAYAIAGSDTVNRIVWLKSGAAGLHIGALGEIYSTRSTDGSAGLSLLTTTFRRDAGIGSIERPPIAPDGLPIFIARDGARIFELRYSLEEDRNQPLELSLPADHLGALEFKDIHWQASPLRLGWVMAGSDGLIAMLHEPREEVLGWAPMPIAGGDVESVAVSPNASGAMDVVTIAVRRTIDGVSKCFIEQLETPAEGLTGDTPIFQTVHLYAAKAFQPDPARSTLSVPHLAGEEVYAWTDQGQFGPLTVAANGDVVLDVEVSQFVIGLFDDTHRVRTLDIPAAARDGDAMGRKKRLHAPLGIALHRTVAGFVSAIEKDLGEAERAWPKVRLVERQVTENQTTTVTGKGRLDVPSGYSDEVALEFTPDGGAPMTILAVTPSIEEEAA